MQFLKMSGVGILALMVSACGNGAGFTAVQSASGKTLAFDGSSQAPDTNTNSGSAGDTGQPVVASQSLCNKLAGDSSVNIHDVGNVSALTDSEVLALIICRAKAQLQFKKNAYVEAEKRGESEHQLWVFRGLIFGLETFVELLQSDEKFGAHHVRLARSPGAGPQGYAE